MSPICKHCGNTNHAPGTVKCAICGTALPRVPRARTPAAVATPGMPVLVTPSGRQYRLSTTTPTLIGSRGCAITLSAPGIAPKHAQVSPSGGGYVVQDMGGGTRVNSVPVTGPTPLQPGDTITVGTVNLVYQRRAAAGRLAPALILPRTPKPPPAVVVPPTPRLRLPAAPSPPPLARVLPSKPGILADGPVQTVNPERQDAPPFDPGRALVILAVGLAMLGIFASVAITAAAISIVLLILGMGGLMCMLPMVLSLVASIFRPILGALSGRQTVSILNFQVLDSLSCMPVDVMVVRKRGGGGNVRLGDKVRVWGKRQASAGFIRAHRVEIYESSGRPTNQALEGDRPWPIWVGLGGLVFAIIALINACSSLGR